VSTDRGAGDNYVYANARTFAYPQHERVYFIGTFHEDFHVKDDFIIPNEDGTYNSWTGVCEQFNFSKPGGGFPDGTGPSPDIDKPDLKTGDIDVNPEGIRGVSEDKRWGDQMFYARGRSFNWSAGSHLDTGGAFGVYNYGNGYTENLIQEDGYTLTWANEGTNIDTITDGAVKARFNEYIAHKDDWTSFISGAPTTIPWILTTVVGVKTTPPSPLKDQRYIDPSAAAVDKTFGSTYSYQMGYSVNIHEGASVSKKYGDDISYVEGNSYSNVDGDSYEHIVGHSHSFFHGDKWEYSIGSVDSEIKVAFDNSFYLANEFGLHAGLVEDIQLIGAFEFFGGYKAEMQLGPRMELSSVADIKNKVNEIKSCATAMKMAVTDLKKNEISLKAAVTDIKNAAITMIT